MPQPPRHLRCRRASRRMPLAFTNPKLQPTASHATHHAANLAHHPNSRLVAAVDGSAVPCADRPVGSDGPPCTCAASSPPWPRCSAPPPRARWRSPRAAPRSSPPAWAPHPTARACAPRWPACAQPAPPPSGVRSPASSRASSWQGLPVRHTARVVNPYGATIVPRCVSTHMLSLSAHTSLHLSSPTRSRGRPLGHCRMSSASTALASPRCARQGRPRGLFGYARSAVECSASRVAPPVARTAFVHAEQALLEGASGQQ